MLREGYLIAFNAFSCVCWATTLARIGVHYIMEDGTPDTLYSALGNMLYIAQSLAIMEVLHSIIGLVRSNPFATLTQVVSRIFVLWGIVFYVPDCRASWGFTLMAISWCLVEVPRYLFFALDQLGSALDKPMVPYPLKWLRYSLFAVLYPSGITGELWTIYNALEYIQRERPLSMTMPNRYNFVFDFYYFVFIALFCYVPGSPFMYGHMTRARTKKLGLDTDKKKTQ
jgi:very-long-chain (3R)-3-hydroxyacyl-CoA dehydratase